MGKTHIGFATHWYQPPTQLPEVLQKIIDECCSPIIKMLGRSNLYLSIDMAQSLGQRLPKELIEKLYSKYLNGWVEFINTPAYHYFLPLTPKSVIAEQLRLNNVFYQKKFLTGKIYGMFPPELGVSPELYGIAANLNYSWLIVDDEMFKYRRLNLPDHLRVPQNWIPMIDGCGVLLRSRLWSNVISRMEYPDRRKVVSGSQLLQEILSGQEQWRDACRNTGDSYIIISLDIETFGHHHKDAIENILMPFFEEANQNSERCVIEPLNTIFKNFPKVQVNRDDIASGSWSTKKEDIDHNIFFPLWAHPDNPYHRAWNRFKDNVFENVAFPNQNYELQTLLNMAFYSCSPWWATKENPDDRKIAGWCLPMFKRIVELAPRQIEQKLFEYYRAMNDFLGIPSN